MSAARTAKPSTVARAKPGSACGAVSDSAGTRPSASSRPTTSARVRRSGRKPDSASETVLTVKNSPSCTTGAHVRSASRRRAPRARVRRRWSRSGLIGRSLRSRLRTRLRADLASGPSRKFAGPSATWPRPQIEVRRMVAVAVGERARPRRRARRPDSRWLPTRIVCALVDPTRQGTHLPHDSSRKKRRTFVAAASKSVPSAIATSAPEPSIQPASASGPEVESHVKLVRAQEVGRGPTRGTRSSPRPSLTPPASSISSRARSSPSGTQYTSGFSTWPGDGEELQPCSRRSRPVPSTTRAPRSADHRA